MINWELLKENYTLEDFCNILDRNRPHGNSKLYKEWEYLEQIAYNELLNEEEHPQECIAIIDEIVDFLKGQKQINMKGFIYPIEEV